MSWFDVCLLMTRLKVLSTVLVFSLLDVWPQKTAAKVQRRGGGGGSEGLRTAADLLLPLTIGLQEDEGEQLHCGRVGSTNKRDHWVYSSWKNEYNATLLALMQNSDEILSGF